VKHPQPRLLKVFVTHQFVSNLLSKEVRQNDRAQDEDISPSGDTSQP